MSLRFRLNLIVSLLVVTFLLIMAGVVIVDARQSIREELDTETTVTLQILSSVLSDRSVSEQDEEPSDAMRSLLHGLGRVHATGIRLFRDDGTLSYASSSTMREPDRTAPSWFADLATPTIPVRELAMPGGRVVLTSDPSSALYEKWEDLRSLARLAIGVLVVVNIAVFWLLGRALKPIENVLDGLSEMERGRLDTRLPRFVLPELEAIGRTFNRMADALESSHAANARLALVAKQSSDAIMIHDLEGRITFWNPAAERLFDYRSEEIMGRPADLLEPPDAEREGAEGAPTVGGSWTLENRETRRMARNGRVVHVALSAAPLVDPGSGIMIGRVYAMRDVTERKLAEETERELVENRRFTQRMQTRLEEERRAIARELHDELG